MKKETPKGVAYYQNLRTKYLNHAKEASASGDRVLYEYNLQFAEHYGRLIDAKVNRPQCDQNYGVRNVGVEQPSCAATATQPVSTVTDDGNSVESGNVQPPKKRVVKRRVRTKSITADETLS
ncbi:MAG: DUF4167 domain-containing protein [Holosporales bacterium]|jgi:hypothetical protein|nr:DUF4167 domain-containing protein [Holosporales bacterium]